MLYIYIFLFNFAHARIYRLEFMIEGGNNKISKLVYNVIKKKKKKDALNLPSKNNFN